MKKFPAVAVLEFNDIPTGIHTTDIMLKKAPIAFLRSGTITRGRYLTMIGGTTASVEESWQDGQFHGGEAVRDHVFLPDVHPNVLDGLFGKRNIEGGGRSLSVLEIPSIATCIRAAEVALKGTTVNLIEIRLGDSGLSGKGVCMFEGELYDIEAAMDIACTWVERCGRDSRLKILTRPHEALIEQLRGSTLFSANRGIELEGEIVEC